MTKKNKKLVRREPPKAVVEKSYDYSSLPKYIAVVRGPDALLSSHMIDMLSLRGLKPKVVKYGLSEKECENCLIGMSVVFYPDIPAVECSEQEMEEYVQYADLLLKVAVTCGVKFFACAGHSIAFAGESHFHGLKELLQELLSKLVHYNGKSGLATCMLNHHNLYGFKNEKLIKSIVSLVRQRSSVYVGNGNHIVDFSYAGNVAHGHLLAANTYFSQRHDFVGKTLHLSDAQPVEYSVFIDDVLKGLGYFDCSVSIPYFFAVILSHIFCILSFLMKPFYKYRPRFTADYLVYMTRNQVFDATASHELIGYRPLWTREEGLSISLSRVDPKLLNPEAEVVYDGPISAAQVALHSSADDAWIIVDGKVYGVSGYLWQHPGGDALLKNAGGDSSEGFHGPQHPPQAKEILDEYYIGELME